MPWIKDDAGQTAWLCKRCNEITYDTQPECGNPYCPDLPCCGMPTGKCICEKDEGDDQYN